MKTKKIFSFKYIYNALVDLLLPRYCLVCGKCLLVNEQHLCLYCKEDIPYTYNWLSSHNKLADSFNTLTNKIEGTLLYSYAISLFLYMESSDYKHITPALKYRYNIKIGQYFSSLLVEKIKTAEHFADLDLVIPVPLHWRRRWKRGYNQAEIIAEVIAKELNIDLQTDILYRVKNTKSQTTLSVENKAKNVKEAFLFNSTKDIKRYKHILLVDDVYTTGSTLFACYSQLIKFTTPTTRISIATLASVDF